MPTFRDGEATEQAEKEALEAAYERYLQTPEAAEALRDMTRDLSYLERGIRLGAPLGSDHGPPEIPSPTLGALIEEERARRGLPLR